MKKINNFGISLIFILSFTCFLILHIAWWVYGDAPLVVAKFPFSYKVIAAISTISILFIPISGAALRLYIESKDPERNNFQFIFKNIFWPSFGIVVLHQLAYMKALGMFGIFNWSQFHTVFISFILLTLALYINTNMPYLLFFITIFARSIFYKHLFLNSTPLDPILEGKLNSIQVAGFYLMALLFSLGFYFFFVKLKSLSLKKQFSFFLITQMFFVWWVYNFVFSWEANNPIEFFTTDNYLSAILTGDIIGYNWYPLLPWMPVVSAGFLVADVLLRLEKYLNIILIIFFMIGLSGVIYIFNFYQGDFYFEHDTLLRNLLRGANDEMGIAIYIETFWLLLILPIAYFSRKFLGLIRLEKISNNIGQSMIIIYYVTIFTGEDLAHILNKYFFYHTNFILLFSLYFLLGIIISKIVNFIFRKEFELVISKVASKNNEE